MFSLLSEGVTFANLNVTNERNATRRILIILFKVNVQIPKRHF